MTFYCGAGMLFGFSVILIRGTSPYSLSDYFTYETKRKLRLVGMLLLVMATLSLGIGVVIQFFSSIP
jgi:putative flippase GtrA